MVPSRRIYGLALAVSALPTLAFAQEPCAPVPFPDGVIGGLEPVAPLLAQGAAASALIVAALLWMRRLFPARLAPEPSTETSRLWNLGLVLALGLLLGAAGVAPAVPLGGHFLEGGALWLARLLGGFVAATAAVFGRDFVVRGQGALDEAREAKRVPPEAP